MDSDDEGRPSMGGLSQNDFRTMLTQPKEPKRKQQPVRRERDAPTEEEDEKKAKKRFFKERALQKKNEMEAGLVPDRDRAKERREGVNPDYDSVNSEALVAIAASNPALKQASADEALSQVSLLESKYLGGDMEHTHLVKGLDYALLEKVRSEMNKGGEQEESRMSHKVTYKPASSVEFRTATGRAVHRLLFRNNAGKNSQMFIPGRTAFVFEMDDEVGQELPTTISQSREDTVGFDNYMTDSSSGAVDLLLLQKIGKIMAYLRQGTGKTLGKRLKKKDKILESLGASTLAPPKPEEPVPKTVAPPKPACAEDDIFEEAGADYQLDVSKLKKRERETGDETGGESSFLNELDRPSEKEGAKNRRERREEERKAKGSIKDKLKEDHYTECFAGNDETMGYNMEIGDDEEDDAATLEAFRAKKMKFVEPTNLSKKLQKKLEQSDKKLSKDEKFNNDFKKIEKLMKTPKSVRPEY